MVGESNMLVRRHIACMATMLSAVGVVIAGCGSDGGGGGWTVRQATPGESSASVTMDTPAATQSEEPVLPGPNDPPGVATASTPIGDCNYYTGRNPTREEWIASMNDPGLAAVNKELGIIPNGAGLLDEVQYPNIKPIGYYFDRMPPGAASAFTKFSCEYILPMDGSGTAGEGAAEKTDGFKQSRMFPQNALIGGFMACDMAMNRDDNYLDGQGLGEEQLAIIERGNQLLCPFA